MRGAIGVEYRKLARDSPMTLGGGDRPMVVGSPWEIGNLEAFGPLQGVTVVDIGTMIAGPFTATLMADFGATVIKIEHPIHGDPLRSWPPFRDGEPLWWKVIARNKQLLSLDLSHPHGQEILKRLVKQADVVIENFRPGTLERWNLSPRILLELNPRLVIGRISGYGQTGPHSHRPGYGTIAEAFSGLPSFTGFPDKPPTLSAFPLADYLASLSCLFGVLMALRRAEQTGAGQVVDASLYESVFRLFEPQVIGYDQIGLVKRRRGNRMDEDSPRNAYSTSDAQWIVISAGSQRVFERLARAIGRPDLTNDPRFGSNPARVDHGDELDEIIARWISERPLAEVMRVFEANDVVAGPISNIEQAFRDPHYAARGNIVSVLDPRLGTVRMQGIVPHLSESPGSVRHVGGRLGENTDAILRRVGLDAEVIEDLRRDRVV